MWQRLSRTFGLYSPIFLLALVSCFAQLRNDSRVDLSGRTPRPVLTPVAKGATHQRGVRLMEGIARSSSKSFKPSLPTSPQLLQDHIFFERNDGQADSQVLYLSRTSGYSLFLTRTGATIVLPGLQKKTSAAVTQPAPHFRLRFESTNPQTEVTGIEALPGTSNYFSGSDPKLWHTRVPQFAKVRYSNLYPGIDLIFYFRDGQLEYDIIASPRADPSAISLRAEGANTSLTREGDVALKIGAKDVVRLRKPHAYQTGAGARVVPTSYSSAPRQTILCPGDYDRSRPLVIDPALIFSTFITSICTTCLDMISDIAVDNTGVYLDGSDICGELSSHRERPHARGRPEDGQTFIVKLDPTGSQFSIRFFWQQF